ncbi:hypothetical protein F4804DRAFT_320711 [Jackrogersella minutella]|nr:hypothetical protein F4804DRAFT_320711 [Jackrogersella minutella]
MTVNFNHYTTLETRGPLSPYQACQGTYNLKFNILSPYTHWHCTNTHLTNTSAVVYHIIGSCYSALLLMLQVYKHYYLSIRTLCTWGVLMAIVYVTGNLCHYQTPSPFHLRDREKKENLHVFMPVTLTRMKIPFAMPPS